MDEAAAEVSEIRRSNPEFTLRFVRESMPYARSEDLELYCDLLAKAGLPE